jgi:hypothetical protein
MSDERTVILALVIMYIAATPGIMEAYLAWHQYPESRVYIYGWYSGLVFVAFLTAFAFHTAL